MSFDLEPVKKWFGYNRKERRASILLIILIILVFLVRVVVPEKNIEINDLTLQILTAPSDSPERSVPSFFFDPNNATYDTLLKAGFGEREARTLISYRNKGGRFGKASDIRKVYGLDSAKAVALIPYIRIQNDTTTTKRHYQKPLIELNSCDSASLEKLPGIGPVLSARIIKYRNLIGGFVSPVQLREVYGLSPETFELIGTRVYADTSLVRKININTADYKMLSGLPYLKRFDVADIMKFRELEGRIPGIGELVRNNIISDSIAEKIRPYLEF